MLRGCEKPQSENRKGWADARHGERRRWGKADLPARREESVSKEGRGERNGQGEMHHDGADAHEDAYAKSPVRHSVLEVTLSSLRFQDERRCPHDAGVLALCR